MHPSKIKNGIKVTGSQFVETTVAQKGWFALSSML